MVDVDEIEPSPDVTDEPGGVLPRPGVYRGFWDVPPPSAEDMASGVMFYGGADEVSPWGRRIAAGERERPEGCVCELYATEDGGTLGRLVDVGCPVHGGDGGRVRHLAAVPDRPAPEQAAAPPGAVRWVPSLADPERPTVAEIDAGTPAGLVP